MNANANIVDPFKGTSTLVRPRFSPGLLLRDDDLTTGVDYTRDLSRLLFRSLFGCGVVCGLRVTTQVECGKLIVTVDSGVALNSMGDPIYVPSPTTLTVDPTCGSPIPPKIWVVLCRSEKCCAPRSTVCGCEEEDSPNVCTREQEGFEIRLVKEQPGDCACMCDEALLPNPPKDGQTPTYDASKDPCWCADPCKCSKDHYAGKCTCACCDPECVVLAVLSDLLRDDGYKGRDKEQLRQKAQATGQPWIANHSVRRFVRPVLMRDPIDFEERTGIKDPCNAPPPPPPPAPPAAPRGIAGKRGRPGRQPVE
jgi:hypothetical protein